MKRKSNCKHCGTSKTMTPMMQMGGMSAANAHPLTQQSIDTHIQSIIGGSPEEKSNQDPWANLLAMKTGIVGLSELSGIVDRNRQNQYNYNQLSTIGQMNPMPVDDYQPNPYNLYSRFGGKLKHYQMGGFGFPMAKKMKNVNFYGFNPMQLQQSAMVTPEQNDNLGQLMAGMNPDLSYINGKLLRTFKKGGFK
jgi:hypothetical protein